MAKLRDEATAAITAAMISETAALAERVEELESGTRCRIVRMWRAFWTANLHLAISRLHSPVML